MSEEKKPSKVTAVLVREPEPRKTKPKPEIPKGKHPESHKLVLFHCHEEAKFYGGIYNAETREFVEGYDLTALPKRENREHLCNMHGDALPDLHKIPPGRFLFEPGNRQVVCVKDGAVIVNTWREPPIRRAAVRCTECPPTIRSLLLHVMGDCEVSLARFLNWLAVIYQTNKPAGTAWIWSGAQMTGKGVVFNKVLKPLFGEAYCAQKLAGELKDVFNSWMQQCVIFNIDEAEFKGSAKSELDAKLRVYITGETLSVRGMHQVSREVPNYLNVILTSNQVVVADLPRDDRRFNVSPPQMQRITTKHPDTDALVKKIHTELPAFAGYLEQYHADADLARAAMESTAKEEMIKAGATGPEDFGEALQEGDLEYFLQSYLDVVRTISQDPLGSTRREAFRQALLDWLRVAGRGSVPVPISTLCNVFNAIGYGRAHEMSVKAFGKFLAAFGLPDARRGHGLRDRGRLVSWKLPERADEYRAALSRSLFDAPAPEVIGATVAASAVTAADEVDLARGIDWLDGPETKQ